MIVLAGDLRNGLLRLGIATGAIMAVLLASEPAVAMPYIVAMFVMCMMSYRLDSTNIWVAFAVPWLLILLFSGWAISDYSRPISRDTVAMVVAVLGIGLVVLPNKRLPVAKSSGPVRINDRRFALLLGGYLAFCALNVALAGFVPLLRGITEGDSGYMDFGVKGVYGLFNAYANAFGLTAFYLWMEHRQRKLYMLSFFLVLAVFLVFVTRQNMMSLLVEAFVVYNLRVRRVSGVRIFSAAILILISFAIIGDLRVGVDIAEVASIRQEYLWVPRAFIWLYTYCYFNILNLDNVVVNSPVPMFDGSSVMQLLPSFLRPDTSDEDSLLEVSSFTVNSFIGPLYHDLGPIGVCVVFAVFCIAVRWYVARIVDRGEFVGVTGYAVLYFCFLFSFFVNFWFYLPVIFQLVFLPILQRALMPRRAKAERTAPLGVGL